MKTNIVAKTFDELTSKEVYEILKARAEIFVVEQNIVYQDMDDIDYDALHVFIKEGDKVIAYFRAFKLEDDFIKIGRVLTTTHGRGDGARLLKEGLEQVKTKFNTNKIKLDAQTHAIKFYEKFGFKVVSEEFLEEGIMHVKMERLFSNLA
ncbi:GNAT family N-acetyltransferase [Lachnospira multipara]|uniref:ElaA protein n=1 Tax=Lachnospira multipara TaxID=28051 RepID=A0A1H5WF91_9FIRM|nr:GNAT family N-acetyltransferase [Lachnospira multipara]SEF98269.1 ElaA protein [Lachnospira multipara]